MMDAIQALINWLARFFETLLCYLEWMISAAVWAIVQAAQIIVNVIAAAVNAAISVLPDANSDPPRIASDILGMLNWLFPVGPLVVEAGLIITAWVIYKSYRYLFKWVI